MLATTPLILFLLASFLGGMATGLVGFAMGLVVAGVWLHIITPLETATLIVGCSAVTQGYSVWKLRHALSWRRLAPFIAGAVIGVPAGAAILTTFNAINPAVLRTGVGVLLVAYSAYSLVRPDLRPVQAGVAADTGIGFFNGMLGGLTGLGGIIITIWCQLRGWPKDVQRAVFQPVTFIGAVFTVASLSTTGAVTIEVAKLYLLALPVMLAGLWFGFKLYGRLDDAAFRKAILLLLLVSGVMLVVPTGIIR